MTTTQELEQFVANIAKAAKCEEEPRWKPEETPLSDANQEVTLTQADWADRLIEEARKLGVAKAETKIVLRDVAAQQIADAVLTEVEGEDLLIEAICRVIEAIYRPEENPDELCDLGERRGGAQAAWTLWKEEARVILVCDRILRGPGDKMR